MWDRASGINWVIQSFDVNYVHLLILSMAHLIDRYKVDVRFMLSVHDEVRYLAKKKEQRRTVSALQVDNVWTRTLFSYKLSIRDLPQTVAFFSGVDMGHVLRKEPNMACLTPSHEETITEGVSCTILDTLNSLPLSNDCLLGDSHLTSGIDVHQDTVSDLLAKIRLDFVKEADLPFLKTQMYKDYKSNPPAVSGGREMRMVVRRRKVASSSCIFIL